MADVDSTGDRRGGRLRPCRPSSAAPRADYKAKLDKASPGTTIVLGDTGSGDTLTALNTAISDGTLPGHARRYVDRIAVATSSGVAFIDPEQVSVITTIALEGGAHGLAIVTGIDDPRLYATSGTADDPHYDVIAVGGDTAKNGPTDKGPNPLPLPGLAGSPSTRRARWSTSSGWRRTRARDGAAGPSTSSSPTEMPCSPTPGCPTASSRPPGAPTSTRTTRPRTASRSSLFTGAGASASIDTGSHAFAWRFPGVIAGGLTIGLLYLLTRILFRRRFVAGLVGLFVLVRRDVLRPVTDRHE